MNNNQHSLPFTGERFVPEVKGEIELEHMHRYLQAFQLSTGKIVLDIACGEGYGSALLADNSLSVYGVDISDEVVKHAAAKYQKDNLHYLVGNCDSIPLPDESVDMVVSFETIEHHDKHDEMMQEIKRVLRPGGILLISSPDKFYYSVEPNNNNVFHVKELFADEFKNLIGRYFKNVMYYGQRVVFGSGIFSESKESTILTCIQGGKPISMNQGMTNPLYWLALASDSSIPSLPSGFYEQNIGDMEIVSQQKALLSENDRQILSLKNDILISEQKLASLTATVEELNIRNVDCLSLIEVQKSEILKLNVTLSKRDTEIADFIKSLDQNKQKLTDIKNEIFNIKQSLSWRLTAPLRFLKMILRSL